MRSRENPSLELETVPVSADSDEKIRRSVRRPGQTWYDRLVMLLGIAAEVEHGLMVQYLYAAYSLGGPDVTGEERHQLVRGWRLGLLKVATEEMGHLITVQNLLCLIGAPPCLERADYPWDQPYYPFPFVLEPLTKSSLACYIHAEMPPDIMRLLERSGLPKRLEGFKDRDRVEVERRVHERVKHGLPAVAVIYDEIAVLMADEERIPDATFDEDSYRLQANWDDWGRGHGPRRKLLDPSGSVLVTPAHENQANVLVMRAATRTQAIAALNAISGQGEAPHLDPTDGDEPSHFERFLHVFQQFPDSDDWVPTRKLAINPTTHHDAGGPPVRGTFNTYGDHRTYIAVLDTRRWALLSNVRYRLLLTYIAHSYRLARTARPGEPNLRGMTMHRAFGEMYNIKTIAGILTEQTMHRGEGPDGEVAGPPFETPYSLRLPDVNIDAWRLLREVVTGSIEICTLLVGRGPTERDDYLRSLIDLDRQAIDWFDHIIAGLGGPGRLG